MCPEVVMCLCLFSLISLSVYFSEWHYFFSKIWQELCLSIKEGKKLVCTGKSGRPESPTGHTQKKKDTQHVPHAGVYQRKAKPGC
jgi:hypothetical protein